MASLQQRNHQFSISQSWPIAIAIGLAITLAAAIPAGAQTYTVLHTFGGGQDGASPTSGVAMDHSGNLYGTTTTGGTYDSGVAYKLTRFGSGWISTNLHSFRPADGYAPAAGPVFGPDGALYGAAALGGQGGSCQYDGCGVIYKLTPPAASCRGSYCPWNYTILHRFTGGADGAFPYSSVVFDQAGNLYGTTTAGGYVSPGVCSAGCGVIYELSPSHGGWTESVLYSFMGGNDGYVAYAGLTIDGDGNLYGTTEDGGNLGLGTVYELARSGSGWSKTTLYMFQSLADGAYPEGGLILDSAGNLYGTTANGGNTLGVCGLQGCGTVFSLSPANGSWEHSVLYAFTNSYQDSNPRASLVMNAGGTLYGATTGSSGLSGNIFELAPANGGWVYVSLYSFSRGPNGFDPVSSLIFDAPGNLYGTTSQGGSPGGPGVVFELTP